jgi:hypothetical protein
MVVANPTLGSVLHMSDALPQLATAASSDRPNGGITPVLVGPDGTAAQDCVDFDDILTRIAVPVTPTRSLPYDPDALQRLEFGDQASGRLGRTLLIRAARQIASEAVEAQQQVSA